MEENIPKGKNIEMGFDRKTKIWDWKHYDHQEETPQIFLYKLHGSIDWERDKDRGILIKSDKIPSNPDLIFGTDVKMQYIDPYLFYIYEFRRHTLDCLVILTIGYGFGDDHINGILLQSLQNNEDRKIISVINRTDSENVRNFKKKINPSDRLKFLRKNSKKFLENISISELKDLIDSKN